MIGKLRQLENITSVDYDPARKTIFFAEDQNSQNSIIQPNGDKGLTIDPFGNVLGEMSFTIKSGRRVWDGGAWKYLPQVSQTMNNPSFYIRPILRTLVYDACVSWISRFEASSSISASISFGLQQDGGTLRQEGTMYMRIRLDGNVVGEIELDCQGDGYFYGNFQASSLVIKRIVEGGLLAVSLAGASYNNPGTIYIERNAHASVSYY